MGTRVMPNASPDHHPTDGSTAPSHVALGDPASFLGIQFGSDPAVLPHEHSSILHPWLPCGSNRPSPSSLSPAPNYLEYYQYHTPQLFNHQDAWNPLQVTGVPLNTSAFNLQPMGKPYQINDYIDRRRSTGQYSTHSENDSQYNGLASGDSGYGSRSCTTRSIAASSFAVDSACSPHLGPHEYELDDRTSTFDLGPSAYGEVAEKTEQHNAPCDYEIKCDYPECNWKGKCPSDKRKHEARHRKLYKCDQPNCSRKQGFGTINDLARHKKCVHKQEPERGPKILYLCFGRNCPRRQKRWPRLDNFRQHLLRMHGDEDADDLLKRSHEWYNSIAQASELTLAAVDPMFEKTQSPETQLPTEQDYVMEDLSQTPCIPNVADETLIGARSPDNEDRVLNPIKDTSEQERDQEPVDATLMTPSDTVQLPSFGTPSLASALDQKPPIAHQDSKKNEYVEEFIADAATNMINALTRMMNSNHRRHSQPANDIDDLTSPSTELCSPKKEILQRILTAALNCLSEKPEPSGDSTSKVPEREPDKKDWIQCGVCAKRTRLRCEMKKHQKRHERPYGCTFPKCSKTFGSKADWKRHENSQHYHIQSWYCTLCDPTKGKRYVRWYYRQEVFVQHLKTHHHVDNEGVRVAVANNRVGENGQSRFWCGFCREIIPLHSQGREAWSERFDHIDFEHFRRGQRIGDWVHCCHLSEDQEREEAKGRNMAGGSDESPFATDDHSENENDSCSDCSSDTVLEDDGVALDLKTSRQMVSCEKDSPSKKALKLEDSSEPGQSRKRKLDTFGSMVDPYQPHADDGSKSKRRISAAIPLPRQ
ncbi:putative C2H2 finger domain protein [Aspergillus fischeri NRRL 181]|uniref:C2H2 type zinc finger domain protein n=1 Tax=Neosartorya fischeri (strain ATCC 1020 / DSM 3700 / CBS 544.65 / FGSC A1164 / JCM 1740 / NRRL 181 / WB 181) TaxID=331117 RepID=A1DB39_NEOFI|nr:C2H2 type zinc finger domain protein [Aspergillus fischeri NRRL 181]EAW20079.1 C2H2 type zinc finger domain protein [Aspergillus fischeri NRRL 181]KAG2005379.1 hypothetical protein GB937_008797 [Aspergillus fischeri]